MHVIQSVEYELAHKIVSNLLQKGLISKAEFDAINEENKKVFIEHSPK